MNIELTVISVRFGLSTVSTISLIFSQIMGFKYGKTMHYIPPFSGYGNLHYKHYI